MTNKSLTAVAAVVAVAGAVFLGGYGTAQLVQGRPAAASQLDKDNAFLVFLRAKDVGTTSDSDAIEMGHRVASALKDEHVNPWIEGTRLVTLGYTGDEAATIVGAAIAVYVPEFSSLVE